MDPTAALEVRFLDRFGSPRNEPGAERGERCADGNSSEDS